MKPSDHSPYPASPVPRKLRSDSKLAALALGVQLLLLQKLETLSYQQTASWLQDTHGICVSPSNLSTFRSRHLESEALKQAYLQAAVFHSTLQDLPEMDPGDEQVEAAVRRLFLFKIVNQGDIATYLQFTRLDPFYATIIGAVIGRMLDVIQSGKFPFASASPSAEAPPAPVPPPPSAASTPSRESPTEPPLVSPVASPASSSAPIAPPSPSNSLKYPKIPAIRNVAFSLPVHPALRPNKQRREVWSPCSHQFQSLPRCGTRTVGWRDQTVESFSTWPDPQNCHAMLSNQEKCRWSAFVPPRLLLAAHQPYSR